MTAESEIIIEGGHTERNYWRDLFRYRELFYFLAWRDVLVRYKQTVIGILWGRTASVPHNARVRFYLRKDCETAE
jgi:hypothetical protein